jgi:predicted AlkP superfamily phosphohydrolase/phosphomutase
MEGLSFDFLIPLISEEKLPNFEWLMDKGSWGALKSLTPCEPVIYYNSFITGKFPSKHSSLSLFNYNLFKLKNSFEILPRYIFMRQLQRFNFLKITPNFPVKRTKGIIDILKEYGCPIINSSWPEKEEQKLSGESLDLLSPFFEDIINDETSKGELIKETFLKDYFKEKKALETKNEVNPALFYLSLDGLKKIKLYFYKYSRPELFGNVPQEEIIKYGKIIEKYYSYYDQIIGRYLSSLKDNELLIIFSPHGIDPIPLWKRFLDWLLGVKEISAHYENAPEGVIFFYGNDVIKGKNIEGVRLIDIAPTILYYYGLPVGKDMDGVVIRSIFNDEFKSDNPVIYISSYDEISLK